MNNGIACITNGGRCKYYGAFCKNPDCKLPVLTSTLIGAYPSLCPLVNKRNSKSAAENNTERNDEN